MDSSVNETEWNQQARLLTGRRQVETLSGVIILRGAFRGMAICEIPEKATNAMESRRLGFCIAVAASLVAGIFILTSGRPKGDEMWHLMQAQLFASGNLRQLRYSDNLRQQFLTEIKQKRLQVTEAELQEEITATLDRQADGRDVALLSMLPGYHSVLAVPLGISRALQPSGASVLPDSMIASVTSWIIALLLLVVLQALSTQAWNNSSAAQSPPACGFSTSAATAWTAAILLPFHWLIYTDILSLLLVSLLLLAAIQGRLTLAAFVGVLAMAVRQTNVIAVAAIPLLDIQHFVLNHNWRVRLQDVRAVIWPAIARYWGVVIAVALFCGFVLLNGRVSIGPPEAHVAGFYRDSFTFSLLVFAVCVFPLMASTVSSLMPVITRPGAYPMVVATCVAAGCAAYIFSPQHPWNEIDAMPELVRNQVIHWIRTASFGGLPIGRIVLGLLVAGAGLTLIRVRLAPNCGLFLATVWCLSILPMPLIEPRYSITPVVLWLVLRQPGTLLIERIQLAWGICLGMGLTMLHCFTRSFI